MHRRCALARAAVLVPALVGPLMVAPPARADSPGALVSVVHGVRGLVADVTIDGTRVLSGFAVQRITDPLLLAAGAHHLQVWPTGVAASSKPILDSTIRVTAGERATAALGVASDGRPTVEMYDDRTLLTTPGSTALAVRGLANAPGIKILAGTRTLATHLRLAEQGVLQVAPGTYSISAVAQNGAKVVPPQDVPVVAGRAVVLYLIGSESDATLGWVAQVVRPPSAASPNRVNTGLGPLPPHPSFASTGVLLGCLVVSATGLAHGRRRRTG